jgi:alanine racemase
LSFTLHVDGLAWRGAIRQLKSERPGLIPVAKGNGYGQGVERLARVCDEEGFATMAVGTVAEAIAVAPLFAGDVLVLTPWDPRTGQAEAQLGAELDGVAPGRVVRTVSDIVALEPLAAQGHGRIVLELGTAMRRFGLGPADLGAARALVPQGIEAFSVHLPLATPGYDAVAQTVFRALEAGLEAPTIQVSHLTAAHCAKLAAETGLAVCPRLGTSLWIGSETALAASSTVRAVHPVDRRAKVGYRLATVPGPGHVVVVDGGTAHGVGLEAPRLGVGAKGRARDLARAAGRASGLVRSPFHLDGRALRYADSPHAQVSILWVPKGYRVPAVGEDLAVRVRHTIIRPDQVVEEPAAPAA